jgi:hypothetical protein
MDRVMEFYKKIRVDGLVKREETPMTMTEYYEGRSDFLAYRHVNFGPRVKKLSQSSVESNPRPMVVRVHVGWGLAAHPRWQIESQQDQGSPDSGMIINACDFCQGSKYETTTFNKCRPLGLLGPSLVPSH